MNVVIHEFAHKLDMLSGDADGVPPLHAGMSRAAWLKAFKDAYEGFCDAVEREQETPGSTPTPRSIPRNSLP